MAAYTVAELQAEAQHICLTKGVSFEVVSRLIAQESKWDPGAVNALTKCTGLMQLNRRFFSGDLLDPIHNLQLGIAELARLMKLYDGDMLKVLAAWNWGQGNLRDCMGEHGYLWYEHVPEETKQMWEAVLRIWPQQVQALTGAASRAGGYGV